MKEQEMNQNASTKEFNQCLLSAIATTLEAIAFVDTSQVADSSALQSIALDGYEASSIRVSVSNPLAGTLLLLMPKGLLTDIASTIHHIDANEISDQHRREASHEILNMVAGGFCRNVVDSGGLFELGLPSSAEKRDINLNQLFRDALLLSLDDGQLIVARFEKSLT